MMEKQFIDILNHEMVKTVGCTEPTAIVIAAAHAKKYVNGEVLHINVKASRNILKNAFSVKIPGTCSCGINLAAALGIMGLDPEKNLEILSDLKDKDIEKAKNMVDSGLVCVELAESPKKVYVEVGVETEESYSRAVIEDFHDNVVLIEVDGTKKKLKTNPKTLHEDVLKMDNVNLDSIIEFINSVDTAKLDMIKNCIELNVNIGCEGLKNNYGLNVGKSLKSNIEGNILANDYSSHAIALTAAGSDARMAGCSLPVMSNSGSGNQGISATIPVVAFAENINSNEETVLRAVTLSNLITIYIKSILGRLSPLCGATISSIGACCGIVFLMGGTSDDIKSSIQNSMGNITGIICDGAKSGCALKVATCTSAAFQSATCIMQGNYLSSTDGIIEDNPEDTIKNFAKIGNLGMFDTDKIVLDVMMKKANLNHDIK
jgi:L-cysteine desulfidase